jgi:3-hydroxyacyl-[acyl-carrier-protein] dehydratase
MSIVVRIDAMRWIWIDKFTEFTSRQSATAVKNVSLAEEHLHDLYPAFPIVPHSLIIEGMAQTAGILVGEARNFEEKVILAKIGKATFHRLVRPGETITLQREDRTAQRTRAPRSRAPSQLTRNLSPTSS